MAQILDMVCNTLDAYLVQKLQTEIPFTDPTRAIMVRTGRLQDDPTVNFIHVLTQSGDPDNPEGWAHNSARLDVRGQPSMEFGNPPYLELGGGEGLWWRRMTVQIGCYFTQQGYDRNTAREYAHKVLGRTEFSIQYCPGLVGVKDEFSELVMAVYIAKSNFTEGGGPPDQFIWRGKIGFCLLTSR